MAGLGSPLLFFAFRSAGFNRYFGGGSRGTEKAFFLFAFLDPEFVFETLVLFGEFIYLALFIEAFRAVVKHAPL